MRAPVLERRSTFKAMMVVLGVVVAFACGWFASRVQHVNDVPPRVVWVDRWVDDLALLAARGAGVELRTPEQAQAFALSSLNTDSHTLTLLYDTLPPDLKQRVDFWMPAARSVAAAQPGGAVKGQRNLQDLVDCVHARPLHGGSVRACFHARQAAFASK